MLNLQHTHLQLLYSTHSFDFISRGSSSMTVRPGSSTVLTQLSGMRVVDSVLPFLAHTICAGALLLFTAPDSIAVERLGAFATTSALAWCSCYLNDYQRRKRLLLSWQLDILSKFLQRLAHVFNLSFLFRLARECL